MVTVMLAKEYEKGMKGSKKDTSEFSQPPIGWRGSEKFDGYRALFYYDEEDNPVFVSRTGKPYNAPEWFLKAMPQQKLLKGMILDGELWAGRENFQMMGTVRKKVPIPEEWMNIQYIVYDITNLDSVFEDRLKILKKIMDVSLGKWNITRKNIEYPFHNVDYPTAFTAQKKIKSIKMMEKYYQEIIENGGEGIMIKHPKSFYENGRSSNMLKYKPSFDREAIIIDHNMGQGKYTGLLGGFVCRPLINCDTYMKIDGNDDHIFTLSGMDDSIRKSYKKTHPIDTIITYECSGFTDKGIPRFGRYTRKREDIVLKEDNENSDEKLKKIIEIFTSLEKHCRNKGDIFRSKSYSKILPGLNNLTKDSELTEENFDKIPGFGKGTREKVRDIIDTGSCNDYNHIQKFAKKEKIKDLFLQIHGVGPACAEKLVNHGFETIEDLRNCPTITDHLNDVQRKGLKYYEDIEERIPYKEIQSYEKVMKSLLKQIDPDAELTIAGSYRRKKKDSGDIDLLLKAKNNQAYETFIDSLKKSDILVEDLARGDKKYMGIGKTTLSNFGRRIDIMYTPPEEYPFAVLYFTGSADFNVKMRNDLLDRGYTLNEHGVKYTDKRKKMNETFKTEKSIFDYFGYPYVEPESR